MCFTPLNIRHPTYGNSKIRLEVPCGKCVECLENRRADWSLRLSEEAKCHIHSSFITLTYSDDHLVYGEYYPTLVKKDLQDWFKRLRKAIYPQKIRYYAIGEYGTRTLRPHYHIILFGLHLKDIQNGILEQTWKKGLVHYGSVSRASVHYVTKYHVNKGFNPYGSLPSFALMSRNPGIGYNYINRMIKIHDGNLERAYYQDGDFKKRLPRYYKDKLYTKEEKEHINYMYNKTTFDEEDMEEHYRNSNINYFEYKQQEIDEKIRRHKSKVNENNKF